MISPDMIECLCVRHIFLKADNLSRGQLIAGLEELDNDALVEAREQIFRHAVGRLECILEDKGIEGKPMLQMKKRQPGRSSKDNSSTCLLCLDIVLLYEYAAALSDTFPRDVLNASCTSRYIQLTKDIAILKEAKDSTPDCNPASHLLVTANVLELEEKLKEEHGVVVRLTDRIVKLECLLGVLQEQFALFIPKQNAIKEVDENGPSTSKDSYYVATSEPHNIVSVENLNKEADDLRIIRDFVEDNRGINEDNMVYGQVSEMSSPELDPVSEVAPFDARNDTLSTHIDNDEYPDTNLISQNGPWIEKAMDKAKIKQNNRKWSTNITVTCNSNDQRQVNTQKSKNSILLMGAKREKSTVLY